MDQNESFIPAQKIMNVFKGTGRFFSHRVTSILIIVILLGLTFVAGEQYGKRQSLPMQDASAFSVFNLDNRLAKPKGQDFTLFWQVWDLVSKQYFDKNAVDSQKMYYGAIQGMVAALGDPYTTFLPPTENQEVKDDLGGNFEGVGMELGFKDNHLVVMAPLDETPAKRAGVMAGDYILKIDDVATDGISIPEAVKKIRGAGGTQVKLQFYRAGDEKPFDVTLTREKIHVKTVTASIKDSNIGYIKISRFGDETNKEWDDAVSQVLAKNVKGVVVDVRNNPGGYMNSAIYIGSEFINGPIMKQENSDGSKQTFKSVRPGKMLDMPVAVLINGGSASASEILAGAIRANNRGKLVGENSFGKGTIQEVQDLDKGAGIHITKARWLMPNDFWVHKVGLKPDIEATASAKDFVDGKDPQLDRAIQSLKSKD